MRGVLYRSGRTHRRVFPRDAFEEVADPALLLIRRVGEQKQLFGSGHVIVHCRRKIFKMDHKQGTVKVLQTTNFCFHASEALHRVLNEHTDPCRAR